MIGSGKSDRAAAQQRIEELESLLASAKAEIERLKEKLDWKENSKDPLIDNEMDYLRAKIERLSGKTGFCVECERLAKKAANYKKALEEIEAMGNLTLLGKCCVDNTCDKPCEVQLKAHSAFNQAADVAKAALGGKAE